MDIFIYIMFKLFQMLLKLYTHRLQFLFFPYPVLHITIIHNEKWLNKVGEQKGSLKNLTIDICKMYLFGKFQNYFLSII